MRREPLTTKQQAVLDHIRYTLAARGYPPTVREIGDALGTSSPSTVHSHLQALKFKGYINVEAGKPRAIQIVSSA